MSNFAIPPELIGQINNLMNSILTTTMKQAQSVKPKRKWFLEKFESLEKIQDFLSKNDNINDVQIDWVDKNVLYSRE